MGRPERSQALTPSAEGAAKARSKEDEFIDRLYDRVEHIWLTHALIATCTLVFLVELWRAHSLWAVPNEVQLSMGANFGPKVQAGEVWRLLTSLFLHGSVVHLALDMLGLWQIGLYIERIYGRAGTLLLFLACGLISSLASMWWRAQGLSVGASGAAFGLYGVLLIWLLRHRHAVPRRMFRKLVGAIFGVIAMTALTGVAFPGIDNAAHLGGLLCGMLLGVGMSPSLSAPIGQQWRQYATWLALAAASSSAGLLWRSAPQVAVVWQRHVEFAEVAREFAQHDAQLEQQVQSLTGQVNRHQILPADAARQIDEDLLPAWQSQIDRLASLSIAPADSARHQALLRYASLHYTALQMFARGLMTGQEHWLRLARQRQEEAEAALLGTRPDSAR